MSARGTGLVLFTAMSLLAGTTPDAAAPAARPDVQNLLHATLDPQFTAGREVLVDLVEIPPNAALEWHTHPGEEFHYYLEGDARVEVEGRGALHGQLGTVGHVPFQVKHRAMAGPQGAKVLVFRVHTQGEPWRSLAEDVATRVHP
jgi:quercetin dioxygenase-like cupin family protein